MDTVIELLGLALLVAGAAMVSVPAALIVAGLAIIIAVEVRA